MNPILQFGAVPVFVDVDLATHNIDPSLIEAAISPKTVNVATRIIRQPNAELSRSRREPSADEAREQRISQRLRKQEGRWLSAQVKS